MFYFQYDTTNGDEDELTSKIMYVRRSFELLNSLSPVNLEASNFEDEWKLWLDAFENYRMATKLDKESNEVQKATLLHLTGSGVQR